METDTLLEAFFEMPRWEAAINKGFMKDIDSGVLARLCSPDGRADMCEAIENGTYEIKPPHTAKIPKEEPGEFRTVYVNEPEDRVLLIVANDLLFDKMPGSVHPRCMSYLKGIGCGRVVKEARDEVMKANSHLIGFKADLSKYFDSVPLRYIDAAFDAVEKRNGKSKLIDVLRKYYHSEDYFDSEDKTFKKKFQSLKQGCSVAAWLADVILYHIDERLSGMGWYVRYCDDILFIGHDWRRAMKALEEELGRMEMKLNPKKVEILTNDRFFKFLGFSIRGGSITMSRSRLKGFQMEIEKRTTKCLKAWRAKDKEAAYRRAVKSVCRFLYRGDGEHSWATQVLPVINVKEDIEQMNLFVMDCLRAIRTGKRKTGGLGYLPIGPGVVDRGVGRNVSMNRLRTPDRIDGYYSLSCMRNALLASKGAYRALCSAM